MRLVEIREKTVPLSLTPTPGFHALWDAASKIADEPLYRFLGDRVGRRADRAAVPVYVGEALFSQADARNLIRYGGLRPDRDVLLFGGFSDGAVVSGGAIAPPETPGIGFETRAALRALFPSVGIP